MRSTKAIVTSLLAIAGARIAIGGLLEFADDAANFGHLSQGLTNCPKMSCGATALVNGLVFLENTQKDLYGTSLITGQQAGKSATQQQLIDTANILSCDFLGNCPKDGGGSGLRIGDFIVGAFDYIDKQAPNTTDYAAEITPAWDEQHPRHKRAEKPAGVDGRTRPTAQFLYDELAAGAAVEIFITYQQAGSSREASHYLTLTGIKFDPDKASGTISFIDPDGGAATTQNVRFDKASGLLFMGYRRGTNTRIIDAVAEVPKTPADEVPEPATIATALIGCSLIGLCRWTRPKRVS